MEHVAARPPIQTKQEYIEQFRYRQALLFLEADRLPYEEWVAALGRIRSDIVQHSGLNRRGHIWLNHVLQPYVKTSYRYYLYYRDPRCALCGMPFGSIAEATIDHIVPSSQGGANTQANKQLAHGRCNVLKGCLNIQSFKEIEALPAALAAKLIPKEVA